MSGLLESGGRRYAVLRRHLDERQRRLLLGSARKRLSESDPTRMARLKALVDPETRGDPMSLLVWTTKSTRNLAGALTAHDVLLLQVVGVRASPRRAALWRPSPPQMPF